METTETVSARWAGVAAARRRIYAELRLLDIIEDQASRRDGIDEMSDVVTGMWTYYENPDALDKSDHVRRQIALDWLGRHVKLIVAVAHAVGGETTKRPASGDSSFGWVVTVTHGPDVTHTLYATVPSRLTCEMVPTGEVEHIPARDVPVMERRCPESIFRGIEAEVGV